MSILILSYNFTILIVQGAIADFGTYVEPRHDAGRMMGNYMGWPYTESS